MRLEFFYNERGFGDLRLMDGGDIVDDYLCRSGSITRKGTLKNVIPPGEYCIIDPSVYTEELGMYIHEGCGWKIRFYRKLEDGKLEFTRLLLHPDGNLPGSAGCVVIQGTDAHALRAELDSVLVDQGRIPVIIKKEEDV